jgi:phosphatidylglycerol:prolipoprotein diacylglycerol transferase
MLKAALNFTVAFEFASPGPTLIQIGPLALRWYGLLIASAVLIGLLLSQRLAEVRQLRPEIVGDLVIWLIVGAIPGARLYYVLFQWDYYRQHLDQIVAIWRGGIAIHGAILGGTLAAWLFCWLKRYSFWRLADIVAPSLALGQAIGRWGNFFNSEAFGAPTNLPWKLFIPPAQRPLGNEEIAYYHPTFLYESLWNVMVFSLLMALFVRFLKVKRGTLFLTYMVAYSGGRVWIEALRTDSLMLGSLKVAQLVSLIGVALGIVGLFWLYGLKRPLPDTAPMTKPASSGF